ncbi:hypothetical protein ElyMa_002658600 [Elysia marginata]|uniref:Uncharacterized protein n=1 Tax=Elysia marginata TaxID=1093978 RepID=A0AAV4HBS7_9GAST|nr:hypothetical protein ElyMa_002658600 [Elysia marginata]
MCLAQDKYWSENSSLVLVQSTGQQKGSYRTGREYERLAKFPLSKILREEKRWWIQEVGVTLSPCPFKSWPTSGDCRDHLPPIVTVLHSPDQF